MNILKRQVRPVSSRETQRLECIFKHTNMSLEEQLKLAEKAENLDKQRYAANKRGLAR